MSDHDWWKGKCLGRVGYFPSKYVTKLQPGERVLQVTHNLQVSATDNSEKALTLLRDQVSFLFVTSVHLVLAVPVDALITLPQIIKRN